jgi:hypothetical protein
MWKMMPIVLWGEVCSLGKCFFDFVYGKPRLFGYLAQRVPLFAFCADQLDFHLKIIKALLHLA